MNYPPSQAFKEVVQTSDRLVHAYIELLKNEAQGVGKSLERKSLRIIISTVFIIASVICAIVALASLLGYWMSAEIAFGVLFAVFLATGLLLLKKI